MKNWFNEFNCERRSLKDEVRQKTALVLKNINTLRELLMPDHYVTYREQILINECATGRKKYLLSLDPLQFHNRLTKVRVDWCKENFEKIQGCPYSTDP